MLCKSHTFIKYTQTKGIIEFEKFFNDENNYYLVMKNGGISLFEYTKYCHKLIKEGKININDWKIHCKIIFKQIIVIIHSCFIIIIRILGSSFA